MRRALATRDDHLSARLEPFDSYWQAPGDIDAGYRSFGLYYKHNILSRLPRDRSAAILAVSCGPGYLVNLLIEEGYTNVLGIDSAPEKIAFAEKRNLPCHVDRGFPHLQDHPNTYDCIVCEQEVNHLSQPELIEWLALCHRALKQDGYLIIYGLNASNPIVSIDAVGQNIDHFHLVSEYSLKQYGELGGFRETRPFGLELYVFYSNPLNYVAIAVTGVLHFVFRCLYKLYGKHATIFTKKIGAVCQK